MPLWLSLFTIVVCYFFFLYLRVEVWKPSRTQTFIFRMYARYIVPDGHEWYIKYLLQSAGQTKATFHSQTKGSSHFLDSKISSSPSDDLALPTEDFRNKYTDNYKPPAWEGSRTKKDLPATRVYCSVDDELNEVRQCVVQRDLVNMFNTPYVQLAPYTMSGYQKLWNDKYSKLGEKSLPPNFALYTHAPIITKDDFENGVHENLVSIKTNAPKRHILNLIGYAFDDSTQPDQIYFVEKSTTNYTAFRKEFVLRLTKTLDYVFACARDLKKTKGVDTIVLALIGGGEFVTNFPYLNEKGVNKAFNAYASCFRDALKKCIERERKKTDSFGFKFEYLGRHNMNVFDKFTDPKIGYIGSIPAAFFQGNDDKKLFVNAWDPHSHAGNGNKGDNSLDGWIGRYSAISYLSNVELNPDLADTSTYRLVGNLRQKKEWGKIKPVAVQPLKYGAKLFASEGSVVDFAGDAIVNAANEQCLGGDGVDGAITKAGGDLLASARKKLPIVAEPSTRCPTGEAKLTVGGHLKANFCIHAVGPNYNSTGQEKGDQLLASAYESAMKRASEKKLATIAFSLISASIFGGTRGLEEILTIAVKTIQTNSYSGLQEVHLVAFKPTEKDTLLKVFQERPLHCLVLK